jgi:predicted nucleic-acid-binding protein
MIAVDTNVLARYYVDDATDAEAVRQRRVATNFFDSGETVFVSLNVVLEFAWVVQSYYRFTQAEMLDVVEHLAGIAHVAIERVTVLEEAVALTRSGLDFADALHLASASHCKRLVTFDNKSFAKKAAKLKLAIPVVLLR